MKKVFFITATFIAALFTQTSFAATTNTNTTTPPMMTQVILRAGTVVSFKLAQELSSDDLQVGNAIRFRVAVNVTVNGRVIVATNAYAEGTISKVKKVGTGENAELHLALESVQAVDGTRIDLDPSTHIVVANCPKKHATATIGALLRAYVLNDTKIKG
jgi:hypothetical protein